MKIGIYGPGDMGRRGLNKHLGDFAGDDSTFVFAADGVWGEGANNALLWTLANYENDDTLVLFAKGDEIEEDLAAENIPGKEVAPGDLYSTFIETIDTLVLILSDADDGNDKAAAVANMALDAGMEVRDLTHAMALMEPVEDVKAPVKAEPVEDSTDEVTHTPYDEFILTLESAEDEDAVLAMMKDKDNRDVLVELAERLGVDVPAGTWQKTIAASVLDVVGPWLDGEATLPDLYEDATEPEAPFDSVASADEVAESPEEVLSAPESDDEPPVKVSAPDDVALTYSVSSAFHTADTAVTVANNHQQTERMYYDVAISVDAAGILSALDGDVTKAKDFVSYLLDAAAAVHAP